MTAAAPTLDSLIAEKTSAALLTKHLDALSAKERLAQCLALGRTAQAKLFETAGDGPPIRLSHFVPDGVADSIGVRHEGRNTVPVPVPRWQFFAKVFTKLPHDDDEVAGYNDSEAPLIHPGYFVAMETDVRPDWRGWGGVVVDYHRVPEPGVVLPDGWPDVVPNSVGLQKFVYFETRDFMRKVSEHVSIGRAAKEDKLLDFWFVLCRKDVVADAE